MTLSLTPVLCDQLEAPGAHRALPRLPARRAPGLARARHRGGRATARSRPSSSARRASTPPALERLPDDLLAALAPFAAWTSAATHAVLPLLATDAGVRLQVRTGVESHRARFGDGWRGGFWLPECAHAPWLDALLEEAGVHATCVDLTDVFGPGDPRHLRPLATEAGPLLVPIDRAAVDLVWAAGGYPSHAAYRDHHHRTARDHHPWANDGAVYDPARAAEQAAQRRGRLRGARRARGCATAGCASARWTPSCSAHWWHEGPQLAGARGRARPRATGLELVHLDDALADGDPAPAGAAGDRVTTWGTPRDLSTWSGPHVADLAWAARARRARRPRRRRRRRRPRRARAAGAAEQRLGLPGLGRDRRRLPARALSTGMRAALRAALADPGAEPALRNLAPRLARAALLEP